MRLGLGLTALALTRRVSITVPGAPTGVVGSQGSTYSDVSFTAPASNGGSAILDYTATSSPGGFTATGATSPLTVAGLTNGVAYTFTVTARNSVGSSAASAASAAVTPTLRNLLTKTQQLDDVAWTKTASAITANTIAAPDGTLTAETLTASATTDFHFVRQPYASAGGAAGTVTVHVKRNNNDWVWFNPFNDGTMCWFNTSTGMFGTINAGITASRTALANGWYRIELRVTTAATTQVGVGLSNADAVNSYAAAGTEAVYVWGGQVELAAAATAYQRIA